MDEKVYSRNTILRTDDLIVKELFWKNSLQSYEFYFYKNSMYPYKKVIVQIDGRVVVE